MKQPKYKLGQLVFFMQDFKIYEVEVRAVGYKSENCTDIIYNIRHDSGKMEINVGEYCLFEGKQEIIEYIKEINGIKRSI